MIKTLLHFYTYLHDYRAAVTSPKQKSTTRTLPEVKKTVKRYNLSNIMQLLKQGIIVTAMTMANKE